MTALKRLSRVFTTGQLAKRFGVTESTINRWLSRGVSLRYRETVLESYRSYSKKKKARDQKKASKPAKAVAKPAPKPVKAGQSLPKPVKAGQSLPKPAAKPDVPAYGPEKTARLSREYTRELADAKHEAWFIRRGGDAGFLTPEFAKSRGDALASRIAKLQGVLVRLNNNGITRAVKNMSDAEFQALTRRMRRSKLWEGLNVRQVFTLRFSG